MQERIIDIIVLVLEDFKLQRTVDKNYKDISKDLQSRGYTENEINLAFSWIFNHLQNKDKEQKQEFSYTDESVRVLHDLEKLVISADAYGYLLQLSHLGLIREVDMEDIIERSLSYGTSNISLDDVKSLAASVIFSNETNQSLGSFFYPGTNTIH